MTSPLLLLLPALALLLFSGALAANLRIAYIRHHLRKRGWPRAALHRLGSFGPRLNHWRKVPPYEEALVVPWTSGSWPPGFLPDIPFPLSDPDGMLWAAMRLLEIQHHPSYARRQEEKYWDL